MPHAPEGMVYVYNGTACRWLADGHVRLAKLVHKAQPEDAPAPVLKPSQMDLMDLPEVAPPSVKHTRVRAKSTGHAGVPGTGPQGETCKSCSHLMRRATYRKTFLKCALRKAEWTGGKGTDIRAKDAACGKWEAKNV